jgi:putative membrane protein
MLSGDSMADPYSWIKILHILAIISWMAGLFYLPRLFVYHAERGDVAGLSETFKIMERRLLMAIMRPAALVSAVTGSLLIWQGSWYGPVPVWLWVKLVLVFGMFLFHGLLERHVAAFRDDRERHSGRYFRIANEVPTLLLIFIVILVIAKPF